VLYLLDANVLITAHTTYYPLNRVPEFWKWLSHQASSGRVKIPLEIFEEVKDGTGDAEKDILFAWLRDEVVKDALLLSENVKIDAVQDVPARGYAPDLTDVEIEQVGRDPFLIAYAIVAPQLRCVVSNEVSRPSAVRANRKIPDVCKALGVTCCNTFALLKSLDFKTDWQP
jgi:Domain of unknown function (DUF4411)